MTPISNASNIPLNQNSGTLPNLREALSNYFQPLTIQQIVKSVTNFKAVETPTTIQFQGVWQPLSAQELLIKPEGERSWKWFMLHCDSTLILNPDDVVIYQGTQYRVRGKMDYSLYGFLEYQLIQDYSGAGP